MHPSDANEVKTGVSVTLEEPPRTKEEVETVVGSVQVEAVDGRLVEQEDERANFFPDALPTETRSFYIKETTVIIS